ncbi:MAG: class I SAM-dependent methyltransferase [Lachnospiraceae bacterium]|nr:class I SAM-dependent methyltransferase [Lachnospiraceae bacterium]
MEKVNIQGVPETMLQTLFARAAYSQKKEHKFYDKKAIEIVKQLDYDFSKAEEDAVMSSGVIARTILFDRMVGAFLEENPDAAIINIACGLDTRVYRLDNGQVRWYNLDLPEVIDIRRRFLEEQGRISMIAKSAMDESWASEIENPTGRVLVVIEGLVMYLTETDVKKILSIICRRFEHADIIMETMNPFIMRHMKEKSIEASKARFTWGVKSGRELERMAPELTWIKDISLVEGMKELYPVYQVLGRIRPVKNISNKLVILRK